MLCLNCQLSNQNARFVSRGQSIYHRIPLHRLLFELVAYQPTYYLLVNKNSCVALSIRLFLISSLLFRSFRTKDQVRHAVFTRLEQDTLREAP